MKSAHPNVAAYRFEEAPTIKMVIDELDLPETAALFWHRRLDGVDCLGDYGTVEPFDNYWIARAGNRILNVYSHRSDARRALAWSAREDGYEIA